MQRADGDALVAHVRAVGTAEVADDPLRSVVRDLGMTAGDDLVLVGVERDVVRRFATDSNRVRIEHFFLARFRTAQMPDTQFHGGPFIFSEALKWEAVKLAKSIELVK